MQKAKLVFKGAEVRKLIDDSKAAPRRYIPYGRKGKNVPVGLVLVKDDGIYLLSNRDGAAAPELISYAKGYGPPSKLESQDARGLQYEKIREAVGGDDFAESLPITAAFDSLTQDGTNFIVRVSEKQLTLEVRS